MSQGEIDAVTHIYTAEGCETLARKKLMIEKVTAAIVEAEGLPGVERPDGTQHDA